MDRIRVEAKGPKGENSTVTLIREDGEEIDISSLTYAVDVSLQVGQPNRVTCHCYSTAGSFEGELENVILDVIPPERIPDVVHRLTQKYGETVSTGS